MNVATKSTRMQTVMMMAGALALVALAWAGGVYAFGHGGPGGHGGGFGGLKMLMQLDLSDDQKARIRGMLPAYRAEKDRRQGDLESLRERMRDLMEAERFEEDTVRQTFREMAPLMEDLAVLKVRFMHDVKTVLTPEQIAQVKERHMDREDRRGEHRRIRESMLDTWLSAPAGNESAQ